jgi:alkylation response protein AidB-like acyl-CoA dehydrogenase
VFFDDVRVPKTNRVGEENKGWTVAKYLLEFERGGVAYSPQVKASAQKLAAIARQAPAGGGAKLVDDPDFRRKMSSLEIQVTALEMSERRVMGALSQGQNPGPASSIFKLRGSEVYQAVLEAAVKAIAYYANPYQPEAYVPGNNVETIAPDEAVTASSLYFNQRAATIYAGSSEVQRTIIAKHVLGL